MSSKTKAFLVVTSVMLAALAGVVFNSRVSDVVRAVASAVWGS